MTKSEEFKISLVAQLKRHEGLCLTMYKDSLGIPTIGYGHKAPQPITMEAANHILQDDIGIAIHELDRHKPFWRTLPKEAMLVVANMTYNMGWPTFKEFVKFWAALESQAYQLASIEMRESRWYVQTGSRAEELVNLMKSCDTEVR